MTLQEKTIEAVLAGTYNAKDAAAAEEKQKGELETLGRKLQTAMQGKDWDAASSDLDALAKLLPEGMADNVSMIRFKILAGKKDYPAAFKLLRQVGDTHKDDPMMQNNLAWMIVADKSIEHPDLDLAQTLAQRATDGAKEPAQKSMFMDTLARVKFMQGSKDEAISLEQKAVAQAGDSEKDKASENPRKLQEGRFARGAE